jgi:hypothetical protein
MKRLRLIDLSIYYRVKEILHEEGYNTIDVGAQPNIYRAECPYYIKVMDRYPDPGKEEFILPTVVVASETTNETGLQIGGGYRDRRNFNLYVYARKDGERDDLMEILYEGFDHDISLRDFNIAFPHYIYSSGAGELQEEFAPDPVPPSLSDLDILDKTAQMVPRTSPSEIDAHRALVKVRVESLR